MKTDVVVIGGGPAGLASANEACKGGAKVVIVEREARLGGILNQCIHNGFGLHYFGEELTGPEYARRWVDILDKKVKVLTSSVVTDITKNGEKDITVSVESTNGILKIQTKAVVLCMGCREKPGPAIGLCGTRPAGIFMAGEAQKIVNLGGKMVGKNVVILGSGDVGLIMARRLTCEGAKVLGVFEIMPTCGGLARNVSQCLLDFNIPLHLSTSILKVEGKKRVTGVWVAPVNPDFSFQEDKKQFIPCDTVLLSVGLLPENDLIGKFNMEFSPVTNSVTVNEFFQTSVPEIFICGNVLHVNDLVDNVSRESLTAGKFACDFALGKLESGKQFEIKHDQHIKYTVPKYIHKGTGQVTISLRVDKEYRKVAIIAKSGGQAITKNPHPVVRAGEMEKIVVDKSKVVDNDLEIVLEVL